MTLEDLGYNEVLANYKKNQQFNSFSVARVISEHKERYVVSTGESEYDAEVVGHLRYTAINRFDFPAVGDWVAVSEYDEGKMLIHAVFPRKTIIERQAVGRQGEKQIIAANIDYAFIVQAVDRDFNINRLERYLTICYTTRVKPIIVLNKIDLLAEGMVFQMVNSVKDRIKEVPVIAISNETQSGIAELKKYIKSGFTYCLLGSSGVGKSTLFNILSGKLLMKTDSISISTNKGRHITSHRELLVLNDGGILIDNPGMREVGMVDSAEGLNITFETIAELAEACKFKDCTHTSETGCAVLKALEVGELEQSLYDNYLKMEREKDFFESTVAEKRKKDKDFGKMIKSYKKRKANK